MLLNRVTLTGIDRWTNVDDLLNLQSQYPTVEFGILVSATNVSERFCDLETVKGFLRKRPKFKYARMRKTSKTNTTQ